MSKRLGRKLVLGGLVMIMGYSIWIGLKNLFRYNAYIVEYTQLYQDMLTENRVNDRMKQLLSLLQDQSFWEMTAKTKLGYVKEGEVVYKIHHGKAPSMNESVSPKQKESIR